MFVALERSYHAGARDIEAIVSVAHNIITMADLNSCLGCRLALVTATRALLEIWLVRCYRRITTFKAEHCLLCSRQH